MAGTWTDNYMQPNPPSYTVTLTAGLPRHAEDHQDSDRPERTAGQHRTTRSPTTTATGTSGTVVVQAGQTATVDNLPFGTYTLSEVSPPAGDR